MTNVEMGKNSAEDPVLSKGELLRPNFGVVTKQINGSGGSSSAGLSALTTLICNFSSCLHNYFTADGVAWGNG